MDALPQSAPTPQHHAAAAFGADGLPGPTLATEMDAYGAERSVAPAADSPRTVNTSAPVVRPLDDADASSESGGPDAPRFSARRARSKKLALSVLAAAGLLAIVALLRAAFVSAPSGVSAAQAPLPTTRVQAPLPTTQAVADDAPSRASAAATAAPAPSVEPSAQASAATPTSVPIVSRGNPTDNAVRKSVPTKKRPWRPSGI